MIFATDHEVGDKIMSSVYTTSAAKFPKMRGEIRARQRDQEEAASGAMGLWSNEELLQDAPLKAGETYKRVAPTPPYGLA